MNIFTDLWLPILLSAVAVFLLSSILHMVIPWHCADFKKLPGEEKILESMGAQGVSPGEYIFPCPKTVKEMGSPEMQAKYGKGPVGFLTVVPSGPPAMGKSLVLWFLYSVLVGVFVAYAARMGLRPGAEYLQVFRLTSTVAVLAYGVSYFPQAIWKKARWGSTLRFLVDGVLYGLVTAGFFGWLWPAGM